METIVISLGGSLIVPNKVDYKFLEQFRKLMLQISKKYKIVIVTGGGKTARTYFKSLQKEHFNEKTYGLIGIAATKLNARVVSGFFNKTSQIPDSLNEVKKELKKSRVVICGALGYHPNMTSDGNAAELASYLKAKYFVNLTDVNGLYNKNPKNYKNAKLIKNISFNDFSKVAKKIKFKAGQHFVLDSKASNVIKKHKIKTVILNGKNIKNIKNFFNGKNYIGTLID